MQAPGTDVGISVRQQVSWPNSCLGKLVHSLRPALSNRERAHERLFTQWSMDGTVSSSGLYLEATRHSHLVVNKMGREPRQEGQGSISQEEHQRVGSAPLTGVRRGRLPCPPRQKKAPMSSFSQWWKRVCGGEVRGGGWGRSLLHFQHSAFFAIGGSYRLASAFFTQ